MKIHRKHQTMLHKTMKGAWPSTFSSKLRLKAKVCLRAADSMPIKPTA